MVGYDSIIHPGREGEVTQQVKIAGMAGGIHKKSITVESNAANKPVLRLSVSVDIKPIIGISTRYLRLPKTGEGISADKITLKTQKKDLKITEVKFKPKKTKKAWQNSLSNFAEYTLTGGKKTDADGYYQYVLDIFLDHGLTENTSGTFIIKTNHPDKKVITIRGTVVAQ